MVLPEPGGPILRDVAAAGTGDLQRVLGGLLPANILEVDCMVLRVAEEICRRGDDTSSAAFRGTIPFPVFTHWMTSISDFTG